MQLFGPNVNVDGSTESGRSRRANDGTEKAPTNVAVGGYDVGEDSHH
jgi:hypothetical protein